MSLATLAKKIRAKRGVSRGGPFAQYMTSSQKCGSCSHVPVNQKGYGLVNNKKKKGCTTYTPIPNQSSSSHVNKKKINRLKIPYCCDTVINISNDLTVGVKHLNMMCTYTFKWDDVGYIISIGDKDVSSVSTIIIELCKCIPLDLLLIVDKDGNELKLPIKYKTSTKKCTKKYTNNKCCVITSKKEGPITGGDYLTRLKNRRSCLCSDKIPQKSSCK